MEEGRKGLYKAQKRSLLDGDGGRGAFPMVA